MHDIVSLNTKKKQKRRIEKRRQRQSKFQCGGSGSRADEDKDGDGILNEEDNCPESPNQDQADFDGDGNPVGLANILTTGSAGSGNLTVTLKHEPDKSASGVSDGDMTNAGGETDISVTWVITVE